ncbi:MAG: hydroxymethylglutaryl-CoA lyase [Pseudomonadota bacterium]
MNDRVTLFEMAPRDGLQNEMRVIPTRDKIRLIDMLSAAGLSHIEAASFVSPKWVPQMADGAEVMAGITRAPGVTYAVLTPNEKGYARARAAGAEMVAIFAAATEGFARANLNRSVEGALDLFRPVAEAALADGVALRGYVSCVTDCPYEGAVAPGAVARVAEALADMGCAEISLGDTIGKGTPESVAAMLEAVLAVLPAERLAGHFHDTGGRAVENISVSLDRGLRVFDASAGGLGGCPYAPGAKGNVASEACVALFDRLGLQHGLDAARLAEAGTFGRSLRSG